MIKRITSVMVLAAALLIAGCSNGGDNDIDKVLGTWHQLSAADHSSTEGWAREDITFAADQTFACVEYEGLRGTYRGTFTVDGNVIALDFATTTDRVGTIAGNRMVLQLVGNNDFSDLVYDKR